MKRLAIALYMLCVGAAARGEMFTVSGPAAVDDAALLDGEFAGWNFGGGPLLEAGFMGGIYAEHRATSLVRFNLRHVPCETVTSTRLRVYKPKDFVQVAPVEVRLYEASGDWREGSGICEPQAGGVTHVTPIQRVGNNPIAATAPDDRGLWIEIELPATLVQRWLAGRNDGLLIDAASDAKAWGHHVYFNASEHWDGKGPELVIEGTRGAARGGATTEPTPNVYALPHEATLKPWLAKNGRLARFTNDAAMSPAQARLFQFYDTTVRERLIRERYQVPLVKVLREMDALVKKGGADNDAALREHLKRVRELLLVWEYIRETSWYTSGPLADVLTSRQLGILFGRSIFGRMEEAGVEKGDPIWQVVPPEKLDAHVQRALRSTRERLRMTPEQFAVMEQGIADAERRENEFLARFRRDYEECRRLLDANDADDAKLFRVVRDMHLNHERFLYYQSIFDTPRWSVFMKHAPPGPLAEWIVETRRDHYERQTGMKIAEEEE